jgi:hypothetical protein
MRQPCPDRRSFPGETIILAKENFDPHNEAMSRDVKNAFGSAPVSSASRSPERPFAPTPTQSMTRPRGSVVLYDPFSQEAGRDGQATGSSTGSVVLFDPLSRDTVVYTRPGGSVVISNPPLAPASDPASGASKAWRVVQLVLLSSLAMIIWYMLRML